MATMSMQSAVLTSSFLGNAIVARASATRQPSTTPVRLTIRAEEAPINPGIDKENPKVVHTADVSTQTTAQAVYCRCWRSKKFPLCDGSHVAFNKATGDNVGPLLVKK
eukprot:TRINITY_DN21005_c0_g1_i1.p1 TRINITY_DN21005_c0_g1~~TRINITY_DN21005_c0_g1_i1.p1  ORF type:complete len:108 (-),score=21.31 TRINITY_DN21005_c0_g1_i1:446-769(-)